MTLKLRIYWWHHWGFAEEQKSPVICNKRHQGRNNVLERQVRSDVFPLTVGPQDVILAATAWLTSDIMILLHSNLIFISFHTVPLAESWLMHLVALMGHRYCELQYGSAFLLLLLFLIFPAEDGHGVGCRTLTFKMHSECFREQCKSCIYVKALKPHHLFTRH